MWKEWPHFALMISLAGRQLSVEILSKVGRIGVGDPAQADVTMVNGASLMIDDLWSQQLQQYYYKTNRRNSYYTKKFSSQPAARHHRNKLRQAARHSEVAGWMVELNIIMWCDISGGCVGVMKVATII